MEKIYFDINSCEDNLQDQSHYVKFDDLKNIYYLIDEGIDNFLKINIYEYKSNLVKVKEFNLLMNSNLKTILEEEISFLKKIRQENISNFIGQCIQNGKLCLIFEYFNCRNLYELLHFQRKKFSLFEKINILFGVCSAIKYLHNQIPPLIHRDICTKRIFLEENYTNNLNFTVKLQEFFVSYEIYDILKNNRFQTSGKYYWMAPEILIGNTSKETNKSDIYSLGFFIWELFSEEIPFDEKNLNLLEFSKFVVIDKNRPDLNLLNEETPKEIINLIFKCWAVESEARPHIESVFNSVKELLDRHKSSEKIKFRDHINIKFFPNKKLLMNGKKNCNSSIRILEDDKSKIIQKNQYERENLNPFDRSNKNKPLDLTNLYFKPITLMKLDRIITCFKIIKDDKIVLGLTGGVLLYYDLFRYVKLGSFNSKNSYYFRKLKSMKDSHQRLNIVSISYEGDLEIWDLINSLPIKHIKPMISCLWSIKIYPHRNSIIIGSHSGEIAILKLKDYSIYKIPDFSKGMKTNMYLPNSIIAKDKYDSQNTFISYYNQIFEFDFQNKTFIYQNLEHIVTLKIFKKKNNFLTYLLVGDYSNIKIFCFRTKTVIDVIPIDNVKNNYSVKFLKYPDLNKNIILHCERENLNFFDLDEKKKILSLDANVSNINWFVFNNFYGKVIIYMVSEGKLIKWE